MDELILECVLHYSVKKMNELQINTTLTNLTNIMRSERSQIEKKHKLPDLMYKRLKVRKTKQY